MTNIPAVFEETSVAKPAVLTLTSRHVLTVAEAFRLTLDALMRARKMNGVALTQASGLSSGTVTRLLTGERFASATVLETLRQAFDVRAAELFDPDAALAQIGLARHSIDKTTVRTDELGRSPEVLPETTGGSPLSGHPDQEMLTALVAYWDALDPDARTELFLHGRRLKAAAGTAAKHA